MKVIWKILIHVSEADVKKAANKHFKIANTRIVVVGKGSDVVANLHKLLRSICKSYSKANF